MNEFYKTVIFTILICILIYIFIEFYNIFMKEGFTKIRNNKSECNLRNNCSSCLDGLASGGDHCAWGNNNCISTSDIRYNNNFYSYDKKSCQS